MRTLVILSFMVLAASCNLLDGKKTSKEMTYSYACLDSAVSGGQANKTLRRTGDIIRNLAVDDDQITDAVQNQYGEAFHLDAIESKTFKLLAVDSIGTRLTTTMNRLLQKREAPSGINYFIYLVDDQQINAFTFGGRIYITKAMYDKCKADSALLYSIIGHEIGHCERGHIKRTIQEMMLSKKIFGNGGDLALYLKKLLTGSFNQRNELEADYYGTDLTYRLELDVCAAVKFWKEMSKAENQYSKLEDFFRTHPFSGLRAGCLQAHIQQNFGTACPN